MAWKLLVVLSIMGVYGNPVENGSAAPTINNATEILKKGHHIPRNVVINGLTCTCNIGSSVTSRRDDYKHVPGVGSYKLHKRALEWNAARKMCNEEDAHLVIINSAVEVLVLHEMMMEAHTHDIFVGAHDFYKEGEWTTIFGETLERAGYDKWQENEPNNTGDKENCAVLVASAGLNDISCDRAFRYIYDEIIWGMGIRGQPIDDQSLSVGINNLILAVNPHRNPVIVVVNGANLNSNIRSSTVRRRDDYQHTPEIGYFKLHTRALNWNSARKSCQDEGGHLAIINSLAEAEVLCEMLKKLPGTGHSAYVGYHDFFKEGEWVTVFGETLEQAGYDNWQMYEPNNTGGKENCAMLNEEGSLNDVNCGDTRWYLCELLAKT